MRSVILCGLFIQMALFSHDHKPSLRTLIVYDSLTPDVQVAAVADVARVKEALKFAAGQAGLIFRPKILTASNLNKKTFQRWLKRIHPKSGDVAFFYYAGRGFDLPHQKWPLIQFGAQKRVSERSVTRRIISHKPDLAVVVFDCYNKSLAIHDGVDFSQIQKVNIPRYRSMPGFKNLFRKHKGWMMWSSGEGVQNAYCSSRHQPLGGLFTSCFLSGFFGYSQERTVNWGKVFYCARGLCFDAHINSIPSFDARFRTVPSIGMR